MGPDGLAPSGKFASLPLKPGGKVNGLRAVEAEAQYQMPGYSY